MAIAQKILSGERLTLRPFEEHDWINLKLIRADPGFRRYMLPANAPSSPSDELYRRRAAEFARASTRGPWGPRLIRLKQSGEIVGSCGVINTPGLPLPELSFCILVKHRKQGYCVEAVKLLLDSLHSLRFGAFVDPQNTISMRVLDKFGFAKISSLLHPALGSFGFWYE